MPEEAARRPAPPSQILERKLATILSADVAGYSRLMADDEEQTLRTFRRHKEVFESLVAMHKGRIFNTAGDAILAEFGSAVEAVRCATEIQAALQTRNNQLPPERQVRFRIGVNLGDVMMQGGDLLGDGVNVAARLQTAAEPGGICISGSVYDQIRNKLSLSFNPLGERNFKNIPQPVRTFSITESEDHQPLPSPKLTESSSARWFLAAAVAVIVVFSGAFWAYTRNAASKAEQPRREQVQAEAAKRPPAPAETKPAAEKPSAEVSKLAPSKPSRQDPKPAVALLKEPSPPERLAVHDSAKAQAAATIPAARHLDAADGVYSGTMCFGPFAGHEGTCFKAEATLAEGRLSGQWPGLQRGIMIYLTGEVSPSGQVQIHFHNERNGRPQGKAELKGTLQNGEMIASGAFRNGRMMNLDWRKRPPQVPRAAH